MSRKTGVIRAALTVSRPTPTVAALGGVPATLRRSGPPKGSRNNPKGKPKSATVRLTRAAREHFERDLASNAERIFEALLAAALHDKDASALSLLVNRLAPLRRGAITSFVTRPLSSRRLRRRFGDILDAIGQGELTA